MIADYLVVAGSEVVHLQPRPTPHAEVMGDRLRRYDPEVIAAWRRHLELGRATRLDDLPGRFTAWLTDVKPASVGDIL